MLRRLGPAYGDVLTVHHRLVRTALRSHSGREVDNAGDGFFAVFPSPVACIAAAIEIQLGLDSHRWPMPGGLRVRMGIHSGEASETPVGLVGFAIHRAARIAGVAHGGQIVVSAATAALVGDELPPGATLRDLGLHVLKDLGRPELIFQVDVAGLPTEFPPLRSLDNPELKNNLPVQPSTFIGRTAELARVGSLLEASRLLTMTGPGGCGKSRLALQLGADLVDGSGDGVWFVELAATSNPELVPALVARVLSVREDPDRAMTDTLADALATRDLLIILDNCEHLIGACAELADALLRHCVNLKILATSREPLGVDGEHIFRVPSLTLPRAGPESGSVEEAGRSEAVALFVERGAQHRPGFALDGANAPSLVSLCRRLDGIPLAIELAAARLRSLSVAEIDERLDDHLRLLTGGSRTALPRQQTLRALIDWSYDLLSGAEQILLLRLSVFAGGWSIAAAEDVCGADGVEAIDVVDLLGLLVDKSLVQADSGDRATRYRLLETVRQYANEHLVRRGDAEAAATAGRHAAWYLAMAEGAAPGLHGLEQATLLGDLEAEHDNLVAAMVHLVAGPGTVADALRMGVALRWYWEYRGRSGEGAALLQSAIDTSPECPPAHLRAAALAAVGRLHANCGEVEQALACLKEGVVIARTLKDPAMLAELLVRESQARYRQGDYQGAAALAEEAVALARDSGDEQALADALERSGANRWAFPGQQDLARAELQEALGLYDAMHNGERSAACHNNLGLSETMAGNLQEARAHYAAALVQWDGAPGHPTNRDDVALVNQNLVFVALLQGDLEAAIQFLRRSLTVGPVTAGQVAYQMLAAAMCSAALGDHVRAATLHGAADALLSGIGELWEPLEATLGERDRLQLGEELGETGFESSYRAGRGLSRADAMAAALEVCGHGASQRQQSVKR